MDTLGLLLIAGLALYWLAPNVFANILPQTGGGASSTGASMPIGTGGGTLTIAQLAQLAQAAGFAGNDLVAAVAIALAESSGNPNAYGDLGAYCCSYGLWQINSYYHPEFGPNFSMLFDPATNAAAAYSVYVRAGNSFSPWSTYNGGQYLAFVPNVQTALG